MSSTKLILIEGLPSTGKSTNSRIIFQQLELNGMKARWVHEMTRPHPTSFFYEACLNEVEYTAFINLHPHSEHILDRVKIRRNGTYAIDLLELEWNYGEQLGEQAMNDLKMYDVWNFRIDQYIKAALSKWEAFVSHQKESDEIIILDSSIFQFQIYTFILANEPYSRLKNFLEKIYEIISPLNPALVYLYRENIDETIDYLIKDRGILFLERIWQRDRNEPYYQNRPPGAEGYKMFLRDYGEYAKILFNSFPHLKLQLEITDGNWQAYVAKLLEFLNIPCKDSIQVSYPSGKFFNKKLNKSIEIINDCLITPDGSQKRLSAKSKTEFYLNDIPIILKYENSDHIIIEGEQICDQWTSKGTTFQRIS